MTGLAVWAWVGLAVLLAAATGAAAAAALVWQRRRDAAAARRLADDLRLMASANVAHRAAPLAAPGWRELSGAVNDIGERLLHRQRDEQARLQAERDAAQAQQQGLAGVLTQMPQAVLLCDGDGHLLLYNDAARKLFGGTGSTGSGAGELALGRALPGLIDRHLWRHVRDTIGLRRAAGEPDPTAHFVFGTRAGVLARARMARLPEGAAGVGERFVLTMDNITEPFAASQQADALMDELTRSSRAALAAIRTSAETMLQIDNLAPQVQRQLASIIDDEARRLGQRIEQAERDYTRSVAPPLSLDDVPARDLLAAAAARISDKLTAEVSVSGAPDDLWLRADSYAMVQVLSALASRLKYEWQIARFALSAQRRGRHASVDLSWDSPALDADLWRSWQTQPLRLGGEASTLSVTEVMARSGGEIWYLLEGQRPTLRLVLQAVEPVSSPAAAEPLTAPAWSGADAVNGGALPLAGLTCTVLSAAARLERPAAPGLQGARVAPGDSLAAVRVVQGRCVAAEFWAGDAAHALATELPALARFSRATVLVSADGGATHEALRALQLRSGAMFDGPALDLLALGRAALSGHQLGDAAALAERLAVPLAGVPGSVAHARALAALWCALLPLLQAAGVSTLEQALAACRAAPRKGRSA